ncbi:MAG: hypothetical protein IJ846_09015 [Alphaproteobacteria bacterium]|nr:hypothetical protein [Alphaproteobacteria bacterium]
MENLELRIQKLEKKCRALKYSVISLMCFTVYAGLGGTAVGPFAFAQQRQTEDQKAREEAGIPQVVEAEVFLLKDASGHVRGIWAADGTTTSFAMMHKEKYPLIAMAVDRKNASMSLTDVYSGKISIGSTDSIRSVAIVDDTKKNNIYLGLTGTGEAAFDLVSTGNAAVSIDGSTSSIDMSGDTAILAMTETVGSTVALKAQPASSALTFLDHENKATTTLSTVDGKSQLYMNSPATKEEKTIGTVPEEVLSFNKTAEIKKDSENVEEENTNAAEGEKTSSVKEENKIVNMKTYSPFAK